MRTLRAAAIMPLLSSDVPHTPIRPTERSGSSSAPADLRLVLDTALDAVVVMDAAGLIVAWNDRAVEIFGWSSDEIVGQVMADFIIPHRLRAAHHLGLKRYLAVGHGPLVGKRIEISALNKSGQEFPVELSISPVTSGEALLFIGCLRDVSQRKRLEAQQALLVGELDHRIRNMLAVVLSIAAQTAKSSSGIEDFGNRFAGRLQALSRTYALLTKTEWQAISLNELIDEVLAPFKPADDRATSRGPAVSLPPTVALALCLIFHELATNAAKYGAFKSPGGHVSISWQVGSEPLPRLRIVRKETGVAPPSIERKGFGSRLIERTVEHELGGTLRADFGSDEIVYRLEFPLRKPA